jgi:signal transduction histidine kinase
MKIKNKFIIFAVVIALINFIFLLRIYSNLEAISQETHEFKDYNNMINIHSVNYLKATQELWIDVETLKLNGFDKNNILIRQKITNSLTEMQNSINKLSIISEDDSITEISKLNCLIKGIADEIILENNSIEKINKNYLFFKDYISSLTSISNYYVDKVHEENNYLIDEHNKQLDYDKQLLLVNALIIFSLNILVSYLFSYNITKPINYLKSSIEHISKGDYKYRIKFLENDEISDFGLFIQDLTQKIVLKNESLKRYQDKLKKQNVEIERKVIERTKELESAYSKLKELDKTKDLFLSNISHDLRTPLTSMKLYNQLLLDEEFGKLTKSQKEAINVICNSTDQLINLVNDLLEVSRYEAKKGNFHFEKNDLCLILKNVCDEFKPTLEKINSSIKVNCKNDSVFGIVDFDKITRVFRNIISNSIKYKQDRKLNIIISIIPLREQIKIIFEDDGMGISKKDLKLIFDKFYQVDQVRRKSVSGSGLGLSIVKHVIKAHNGNVKVESELNKGTKITIVLPKNHKEKFLKKNKVI